MQGHISCMEAMQTKEQTGKKSELISFWVLWICRSHRLWLAVVVASWYSPSKRNFSEIYQVARPRAIETSLLVQIELVQLSSCTKATAFYYSKRMFLMFSFFFFLSPPKQEWDSSGRSLPWNEGIWGIIHVWKKQKRWCLKQTQREKNKMIFFLERSSKRKKRQRQRKIKETKLGLFSNQD